MKIVFMGTPEFAVPGLQKIQEAGVEIGAVVTRPDRRTGRGRKVQPPAVKTAAERLGLKTVQPKRWEDSDLVNILEEISPDLMVVSAYGRFIPRRILKKAGKGGINLHPSLLPRYRGAAPIQWALINGETETGVTVIEVADEMDAGDIYGQRRVSIRPEDTASTLFRRLAEEGGDLLVEVLSAIASGRGRRIAQDENLATFAPRLTKEDGWIDWSLPAQAIYNRFRGDVSLAGLPHLR